MRSVIILNYVSQGIGQQKETAALKEMIFFLKACTIQLYVGS